MKKKMMKLVLTMVVTAAMSMTTFAAEGNKTVTNEGNTNITVVGKYQAEGDKTDVYSVDIAWGAMEFTYSEANTKWNPEEHREVETEKANWTATGNAITVTNHSNVGITASFTFASNVDGVKGEFYDAAANGNKKTTISLDRAEEGSQLDSREDSVYFNITEGKINQATNNLGSITVSIAKKVQ